MSEAWQASKSSIQKLKIALQEADEDTSIAFWGIGLVMMAAAIFAQFGGLGLLFIAGFVVWAAGNHGLG